MHQIHQLREDYGSSDLGQGQTVRIEFVSANPTGPLHVGHGRGAVIGDVLSSLYQFAGYKVIREYYLNDCGNQMNILGKTTRAWIEALKKVKLLNSMRRTLLGIKESTCAMLLKKLI